MLFNRLISWRRLARLGLLILLLSCAWLSFAANPMEDRVPFSIAAQPLGESLRSLAKQANLQILFDSALVNGRSARALRGTMSARAALAELLHGTGLEAREQVPGVVVIRKRPARSACGAANAAEEESSSGLRWLMMVVTKSTDPSRDAQFNKWYDDIDIPDVLQVPGYKRARRGQRLDLPQLPRADSTDDGAYVALYDIRSRNIDRTMIDMLMASRKMEAVGRSTNLLKVTERLYFRQLGPAVEAPSLPHPRKKEFLLLERVDCCRDEATDAQLNDWYDVRHIPDMLKNPGFIRATRYQLYRVLMVEPRSAPRFLTVYEVTADSAEQVADLRQSAARKLAQEGRTGDLFVEHGTALYLKINDVSAR